MAKAFDAIVIGARCAGSPTAMLLARKGYRVLLVDRARFPSDTVSTHLVHPLGVEALSRWGLLDRLIATGCPPVHTYCFDFGPFTIAGSPGTEKSPVAFCPRRTVLDKLLIDAAAEAGAEVREGFTVEEVVVEGGRAVGIKGRSSRGGSTIERAGIVVGADGLRSLLAEVVRPEHYHERPRLCVGYYTYWSGLPMHGRCEVYIRDGRAFAAWPTHEDLTLIIAGWPYAEFEENKKDIEGNYLKTIALVPAFADRLRGARREAPFAGMAVPNYFRKPYGPGWVFVGDAGYNKDFITSQGIMDAFHDAELCVDALDRSFSGARPFEDAMNEYQRARDARVKPMYDFTCELATLQPPPPEMQQLLAAVHGNQKAMDDFARMNAGTISPAEFFAPENVNAITSAAQAQGRAGMSPEFGQLHHYGQPRLGTAPSLAEKNEARALMAGSITVLYGTAAYVVFLVSFLYTIGFVGNVVVPKSIDSGKPGPLSEALIINTLLLGLFAIQHSVMARQGFKRWWARFVPPSVERSTYVLFASLALLLLYWQWRPIPGPVWTVESPTAATALNAIFWFGWGMLLVSTFLISHFELFGLSQVFARLFDRQLPEPAFKTPFLYRSVRHPIYLSFLLTFWATPAMTVGHLLFSLATTAYILVAIQLEERDLVQLFGDQYRRYRREVAMLFPFPRRKSAGQAADDRLRGQ